MSTTGFESGAPRFSAKIPFDVCFPGYLKLLLRDLAEAAQQGAPEAVSDAIRECLDFLLRYWTAASVGALDRLHGTNEDIPAHPSWSDTLRLLRYSVMAWETHPQSSFRTLLRLGFFEAGDPPRPRLQCRWLGIAGEWQPEAAAAEDSEVWESTRLLPGSLNRYLDVLVEWIRASRPLFVKLNRRFEVKPGATGGGRVQAWLEDGRGKQLPLLPDLPWDHYAILSLEQIEQAEAASTLSELPTIEKSLESEPVESDAPWLDESIEDILASSPEAAEADAGPEVEAAASGAEPEAEAAQPEKVPEPPQDGLDALLGLDLARTSSAPRWRPRPLEFPGSLPQGVRRQMELARRALLDYANLGQEDAAVRSRLAQGLVAGLTCLLELTARVACVGLGQVAPLPEPLRLTLQQPVPASQAVKLLHFAWNALRDYPEQPSTALLQSLFFELNAPDVPRLHARWLGLPDAPMIGIQHVTFWLRLSQGELQVGDSEFVIQLRELLDTLQLWLVAGSPLWAACDPELYIRHDGHWSGVVSLGGERFSLDPDLEQQLPLEDLLKAWCGECEAERPPFYVLDEVLEFVESVAAGSGLVVQGPSAAGKSFLVRDLVHRQPQVGELRCGWIQVDSQAPFALEHLNSQIEALQTQGFPWNALGSAALADLQRHSSRENLFTHYFAALKERNLDPESNVRLVLMEDGVDDPESILWCHLPLPAPFCWLATCRGELPAAWNVPCPPARLPMASDELSFQKLQVEFLSKYLDWARPELLDFCKRAGEDLLVLRLWVGALDSGLAKSALELPGPEDTLRWLLTRLLDDRPCRGLLLLLASSPEGVPLGELLDGSWASSLRTVLQYYPWLLLYRQERILLRHARLGEVLRHLGGTDRREVLAGWCQYLAVRIQTAGRLQAGLEEFLQWSLSAQSQEVAWTCLQSPAFRAWKDQLIHQYDTAGWGHLKVQLVSRWLEVLELALQYGREKAPLQLHQVLEEQLWSYSSRALTYRGLGRLHEALLDVEQAIAGFRPLVEQRPELANGLAAAFNRRSEILHELGKTTQALRDADTAVELYGDIASGDPGRWEPLWALALHHRSGLQQALGKLEAAENDLRRSLSLYQPHRDVLRPRVRLDLVQAYLSRAQLATRRGDGLLARDDCQRCLELLERFEEPWIELRVLQARACTQLAEAHRLLEDDVRALEASDRATSAWRTLIEEGRLDLRGVYAQELTRRAALLHHLGQLQSAFEAVQPAVEMLLQMVEAEGRGDLVLGLSQSLILRGRVWMRRGRLESSRRDLSLAYHYLSNQSDQWGAEGSNAGLALMVDTVTLLAQLSLRAGQAEAAAEHLRSCLAWLDTEVESGGQENRALLESLLGRAEPEPQLALEAHQRALTLYTQLVDEQGQYQLLPNLAEAHLGRARTYRLLGEEELALADANQAVELITFLSEKGGDPGVLRLLPHARFELAETLGLLGQLERARAQAQDGLQELELHEADMDRAEYFLGRSQALTLLAGLQNDEEACGLYQEVLLLLSRAQQEGAETAQLEGEVRRHRAEALLRLGRTGEAIEELLGHSEGREDNRLGQMRQLLDSMLEQALEQWRAGEPQPASQGLDRVIQVATLLLPDDEACLMTPVLIRTYRERAELRWSLGQHAGALEDLGRGVASACLGLEPRDPSLVELLELRAHRCVDSGCLDLAMADLSRALEATQDGEVRLRLLRARAELEPLESATWLDLRRLEQELDNNLDRADERAWLCARQARWLAHHGWKERALVRAGEAVSLWQRAYVEASAERKGSLASETADFLAWRFSLQGDGAALQEWAMWLGDQSSRHPDLADRVDLEPVRQWFDRAGRDERARFAQIWLALLAEHVDLPERLFELVPLCLSSLQVDDADSSSWVSVIDILDKQAALEAPSSTAWEGRALQVLLDLPRSEIQKNPDLEFALFECLRRWSELPAHRLALTGISAQALSHWLES